MKYESRIPYHSKDIAKVFADRQAGRKADR
jgi:hypothetical protein